MPDQIDWNIILGGRGGTWAYFLKNRAFIGEFIRANELKPAVIGAVSARSAVSAKSAAPAKAFIDLGIRGGIRVFHLHFNNRIYLLNEEQWAKFSGNIIAQSKARLAKVKEVSFDQAMLLGSMAETLTKS